MPSSMGEKNSLLVDLLACAIKKTTKYYMYKLYNEKSAMNYISGQSQFVWCLKGS